MKKSAHLQTVEGRNPIILNASGQPIGPEKYIKDFTSFVGTLSRMPNLCPLNVEKWTDMDKVYKGAKERIWKYVKWRGYKCRLKRDYYKPYKTNKMRWKNRPTYVSAEHFKWLLKQWNDLGDQDRAKINAANRAKQRDMHTCGPKSFARIREDLARMEEIASQQAGEHVEGGESSNPVDPFEAVMGKEHKGRLRLYGRGVTASTLGKVSARSSGASVYVPEELLKSIKEDVV
ncbi:hypothetical protein Dimus_020238 [Dionaea muscipula]